MIWSIMKFSFWVIIVAALMVFSYTYRLESGLTLYQMGYRYAMGELPPLDLVSKTDQGSLDNLIKRSVEVSK
ncbi:MAG: hypothetical protein Kow0090_11770 [Myxococcota bacterium]